MEKNISTIIFDFGNVLIDLNIDRFSENISELTGLKKEEEESLLRQIMASYETGMISTELFINQIIKISNKNIQAREIIQCWNSMLVGIKPETLNLLTKLKAHYRTFILSNTNPLHIEWVHHHLEKEHKVEDFETAYLHGAFYSHELKLVKPDPKIYQSIQSKLDIPAGEILFIDDLEENVAGARDAGWNAICHRVHQGLQDTLNEFIPIPGSS